MRMRLQNRYKRSSVAKGTTILTAEPFAYVLRSFYRYERCDHCLQSGNLLKCSACHSVYYCKQSCQRASWAVHKQECANIKRISPVVVPDIPMLTARIIIKLNNGGGEELGYYSKTKYRKFKDLMSHYSDIKKDKKKMDYFECLYQNLVNFFGDEPIPNSAELIGIFGRICINCFNIFDLDMNSIGVGLYLGPSIMDHSCNPNAVVTFDGIKIIIRTIEDLPRLDWSQIRISYIDVLNTTKERRLALQSSYYFWCNCTRCEHPDPMEESVMCPNKSCSYPSFPDADVCKGCSTKFSQEFKETYDEISKFTAYHLEDMKDRAYLDISRMCLKKQEGILHPLNVQHVQTLQCAFDSATSLQHFEEAESFAKKLMTGYLLYYGEIHPVTGLLYLMVGKIQLNLKKSEQALELLNKANSILTITHGEDHTVMRENLKPLIQQAVIECL